MKFWNSIKPYFTFSKNEKRGVIVLLTLIVMAMIIRLLLPSIYQSETQSGFRFEYIEIERKKIDERKNRQYSPAIEANKTFQNTSPEFFDPNTATLNELVNVGFSKWTAKNLIKFREAGGIFKTDSSLYKIYGIDSTYTELISSYCRIDQGRIKTTEKNRKAFKEKLRVELNTADTTMLIQLPGIGKVLSSRIIDYRESLGGFVNEKQLLEVYGLKEDNYNLFKTQIIIDSTKISTLLLNKASAKELSAHPYITNYQSKAILKYRELIGEFQNPQQLVDNYILTEEEYKRVKFYLSIQE